MMEIQTVGIRRVGSEKDPFAKVVVSIQDQYDDWRDLGDEYLTANFSHNWVLPECWRKAFPSPGKDHDA